MDPNVNINIKQLLSRMQDMTENHEAFIRNEATAIEKEVSLAVKKHLTSKRFPGYKLYIPNGFPKTLRHPVTDQFLTDLDGVYILTTNPEVAELNEEVLDVALEQNDNPLLSQGQKDRRKLSPSKCRNQSILVIVEAKHNMTKDRVQKKLAQLQAINEFLSMANTTTGATTTKRYQKNVAMFGFDKFDPNAMLYLGGPLWDRDAMAVINSSSGDFKSKIGIVKASGTRYGVADASTAFVVRSGKR